MSLAPFHRRVVLGGLWASLSCVHEPSSGGRDGDESPVDEAESSSTAEPSGSGSDTGTRCSAVMGSDSCSGTDTAEDTPPTNTPTPAPLCPLPAVTYPRPFVQVEELDWGIVSGDVGLIGLGGYADDPQGEGVWLSASAPWNMAFSSLSHVDLPAQGIVDVANQGHGGVAKDLESWPGSGYALAMTRGYFSPLRRGVEGAPWRLYDVLGRQLILASVFDLSAPVPYRLSVWAQEVGTSWDSPSAEVFDLDEPTASLFPAGWTSHLVWMGTGDVTGDGEADMVLVGDPQPVAGGEYTFTLVGRAGPFDLAEDLGAPPWAFELKVLASDNPNAPMVGDWNGDGVPDVGVFRDRAVGHEEFAMYFGPLSGNLGLLAPSVVLQSTVGPPNMLRTWTDVDVGDVNGDGYQDLVAFYQLSATGTDEGGARVFLGPFGGQPVVTDSDAWMTIVGPHPGAKVYLGAVVGDVDGDGTDDLVLGGQSARPELLPAGVFSASVVSGFAQEGYVPEEHSAGGFGVFAHLSPGVRPFHEADYLVWGGGNHVWLTPAGGGGRLGDLNGDGLADVGARGLVDPGWGSTIFFLSPCAGLPGGTAPDTGAPETGAPEAGGSDTGAVETGAP